MHMRFAKLATYLVMALILGSVRAETPHVPNLPPAKLDSGGFLHVAQNRDDFQSYDNYDLNGVELRALKNVDPQTCSTACRFDNRCEAFTFNKWERKCSLKTSAVSSRFDPISVAGVPAGAALPPEANMPWKMQRFSARSFRADPYRSESTPSYEQCERICESDKDCVALSYVSSQRTCKLFGAIGTYSTDQTVDSEIKHQVAPDEAQAQAQQDREKALLGDCDRSAAFPSDPTLPQGVTGVAFNQIDAAKAVPACREALRVHPNDPRIAFQLGRALDKMGGSNADLEAVKQYRFAADAGHAGAMNNLGNLYQNGRGVEKNELEGLRWYQKAADAGLIIASLNIGAAYQNGLGVSKDAAKAAGLYRQAAQAGSAAAMSYLGVMYREGNGVGKDQAEAARWFTRSAEAGYPDGMNNIGVMYSNGTGVERSR